MKIGNTLRFHRTAIRMAEFFNDKKYCYGCGMNTFSLSVRMQIGTFTVGISVVVLQKARNSSIIGSTYPTPGHISKVLYILYRDT